MNDIHTEGDIETLVYTFYAKVRTDEMLSPVFNAVIKGNWDEHLRKMCDFWSTLLLYTRKYMSDPMAKHMPLPLERGHFERWLTLFNDTIAQLFEGTTANEAKRRAANIARLIQSMKNNI
ncbi:MAG TPA: group III truncated hemoglobin [Puia sp.]